MTQVPNLLDVFTFLNLCLNYLKSDLLYVSSITQNSHHDSDLYAKNYYFYMYLIESISSMENLMVDIEYPFSNIQTKHKSVSCFEKLYTLNSLFSTFCFANSFSNSQFQLYFSTTISSVHSDLFLTHLLS